MEHVKFHYKSLQGFIRKVLVLSILRQHITPTTTKTSRHPVLTALE